MGDLPLEEYKFIAIWIEAIFWGMYTVLFWICIYVLLSPHNLKQSGTSKLNKPFIATASLMYLLSTMHFVNDFARGFVAFLEYGDKGGPKEYYEEISVWHYLFREALYMTTNIVADALLVYRLYVVWGRKRKFVFGPIILVTATAVFGYLTVWGFSRVEPGQNDHAASIYHWAVGLFSLSLVTNVVVVGWRIWLAGREVSNVLDKKHGRKYNQALAIIIESGALCSVALMLNLILYVTRRNAVQITFDSTAQIMGIAPTLTIVRVGLGLSQFQGNNTNVHTVSIPIGRVIGNRQRSHTTTFPWVEATEDSIEDPLKLPSGRPNLS
uniref:Uncharacterized protein n=1 Tax=Moniliophthora roreri TaxID=221103 RepID=A0A0W0EUK9_MONRR